jgi:Tfp pilus assembly protein PilX
MKSIPAHGQRGVALAVALIVLVITTLIALTAARLTGLELRMSLGEAQRIEAQQEAVSLLDAVTTGPALDLSITSVGYSTCTSRWPNADDTDVCDDTTLAIPDDLNERAESMSARVTYLLETTLDTPPRMSERLASSVTARAAQFEVQARYDPSGDAELGPAEAAVAEGLIRLYAVPR